MYQDFLSPLEDRFDAGPALLAHNVYGSLFFVNLLGLDGQAGENDDSAVLDLKGNVLYQDKIPFKGLIKALTHKVLQEKIKKKFNRSWRFIKGVRRAIRRHGFRQHSRCMAEIHLVANKIISIAEKFQAYLSLENLKDLRADNDLEEVHLWAYRKQQFILSYKALLKGLGSLPPVSAKRTSSKCPICGRRLKQKSYEELV